MKRQHFLVWVILFFCSSISAQDQTNFTQFYLNPYLINPSYVGIDGKPAVAFTYRKQWATLVDGPKLSNFTFHTPVSRRVSVGFSAIDDQKGLLHASGAMVTAGYNLHLGPQSFFRFGLSGGISSNSVDLKKLEGLNDPALVNLLESNMSVLGNAGISFHLNTFHAGFSLPVIFQPSYISKDAFSITEISPFQSAIFHFSNRFYFNHDRNVFEPYAIYRMTTGLPPQFEVAAILHLNHMVWVGGSFKQDFGISGLGGIKMKNFLAIGASYSLKNSGTNELNSPTYEVTVGILLGKHRKETPVYSFVNTEKEKIKKSTRKSASELLAEKRKAEELAKDKHLAELEKKKQAEEIARKQALVDAQKKQEQAKKLQEAELKKQQQQAELLKQQQEADLKKQQALAQQQTPTGPAPNTAAETAKKQQEELAKKQQEDLERKQREDLARKNQLEQEKRQQDEARRKAEELAFKKKQEEAFALAEAQKKQTQPEQYTSTIRQDTMMVKHKPRFDHVEAAMEVVNVEVTEHNEADEKERIARLTTHANDPDEHHEGGEHPNSERHEFVKRGSHEDELDVADYVITGVFKEESNARHFTDGLKKLGFKADYGHLTEKAVWYVYLHQGTDINQARTERDRYRKMKIFRDAWLLTVHH
jgi:type IX secretion system PorP/SprF family membrane protein